MVLSVILLGAAVLGSVGVFAYERYLIGVRNQKAAEVTAAEQVISSASVEEFIRTRDRFASAQEILDSHVAASQFFDLLESLTLSTVRFNQLSFELLEDRSAQIQMTGIARTFNALAAQSSALASEKRIKSAIFSGITVNQNNTVAFGLSADLDPRLITLSMEGAPLAPAAPLVPATSTPATTTATSTATSTRATSTAPVAPRTTPTAPPAAQPSADLPPEVTL